MSAWSALAVCGAYLLALPPNGFARPPSRSGWLVLVPLVALLVPVLARVPPVALVAGSLTALAVSRELARRRMRLVEADRRNAAIEACGSLAADLRSGRPPGLALASVAADWPALSPVADADRLGSDVAAAWRRAAERPGAGALSWVGASWALAHRSGAGLAGAIDAAVHAMEDERASARVLETELASARATARLLAVLPLGVLLIGRGAGGDPFGFLLHSAPGAACLGSGLLLAWVGLLWIERIGAEPR